LRLFIDRAVKSILSAALKSSDGHYFNPTAQQIDFATRWDQPTISTVHSTNINTQSVTFTSIVCTCNGAKNHTFDYSAK
jgi:hypothetical protein